MRMRPSRKVSVLAGLVVCATGLLAPATAAAQTPFIPYFFENNIRYNKFDWHIYNGTDHFEIYYYPEIEKHLERTASYLESAYQHVSTRLKHDLHGRIPVVLFKTAAEFQQQHIAPMEMPEGVLAFAEPEGRRMVLPMDLPSDQLYQLMTHELTHIFEFDIVPRGLVGGAPPLWIDEGLADHLAGAWNPVDLMTVRDAALTDNVPRMSEMYSAPMSGRTPYNLGHAAWEFIEQRWGLEGLQAFLFSLRKSVIGAGENAYEEALKVSPEDFDEQFDRWLKERFRPFRDKELPADYGRNIAPRPDRSNYARVASIAASPTGEMIAAFIGNRRDLEWDIVVLSAKDGQLIRPLTTGFDKDRGFQYISMAGGLRGNLVPWIAWAPVGDRVAYFVRTERNKTLVVQNVVTGKTEQRIELETIDMPESPSFSPDGTTVAFSGMQDAIADIFTVDLTTGAVTNVTKDEFGDWAPAYAPDGRTLVYSRHISGNDKLFQLDLATGQTKQLTFGTHDDIGAAWLDDKTVVFTSTAIDPNVTLAPEVARNANIPNIWSLDLQSGELKQYTDAATGNLSPVVLRQATGNRLAFITYYKGDYGLHVIDPSKTIATVASGDFGAPGPVVDFQPPLSHTLVRDNIHKKRFFEKMTMVGRPPVNLGVTSGGTFYGSTEIAFADVLGDKQISFYAQSFSQYRTTAVSYLNVEHRLQYALQGFSQDTFYYGQNAGVLYDPVIGPLVNQDRDLAEAVQSTKGGTAFAIYPLNRYTRVELFGGYMHLNEAYTNQALQDSALLYQVANTGSELFRRGHILPLGISLKQETAVFREFGPVAGRAFEISYNGSPQVNDNWISRQTLRVDARRYLRVGATGTLALRLKAQQSWGRQPDFMYFGGNSELRGYDYLEFIGHKAFFMNAEMRFPVIDAMITPLGILGGLRGVLFAGFGAAGFNNIKFEPWTSATERIPQQLGFTADEQGNLTPVMGPPLEISGFRLKDSRASYGIGLESALLGFPMHFDWSWRTQFNRAYEDYLYSANAAEEGIFSGSQWFRKPRFSFWIGYDF